MKTATLRSQLRVDGVPVPLRLAGAATIERGDDPADSTAAIIVNLTVDAPWPAGWGDWLGRRELVLVDEVPTATGHVHASVSCTGCTIASFNSGAFLHDDKGVDQLVAASVSRAAPLELHVRLGTTPFSCGSK